MLDKAQTITFENEQIVIGEFRYSLDDIQRYEFANSSECGLTDINGNLTDISINTKGLVTFAKEEDITSAHIYTLDGRECYTTRNGLTLDFSTEPAGVYIISFANKSFKIIKR